MSVGNGDTTTAAQRGSRWPPGRADLAGSGQRVSWSRLLAHPVFWISIVLLILNDRVLKFAYPGLITGKLSDFAGVTMIALLLIGISGRVRASLVVVAALFGLLKTVPAVAGWAVPVLGGRTRTDPTDLIALAALIPLGFWLARRPDSVRSGPPSTPPRGGIRSRAGVRPRDRDGPLLVAAKIGGVGLAVLATTATQCGSYTEFERFDVAADGTFVVIDTYAGRAWRLELPIDPDTADDNGEFAAWTLDSSYERPVSPSEDQSSLGNERECASDGTCVQIRGLSIVEIDPGGTERVILDYNSRRGAINSEIEAPCQDDIDDRFPDVATDGEVIVVAMGVLGAMVRNPDGTWMRTGGGDAFPSLADTALRHQRVKWAAYALPVIVYVVGLVLLLLFPGADLSRVLVAVFGGLGVLLICITIAAVIDLTGSEELALSLSAFASVLLAIVLAGAAIAGLSGPESRPPSPWS